MAKNVLPNLQKLFTKLKDVKLSPRVKDVLISLFIGIIIALFYLSGSIDKGVFRSIRKTFEKFEYIALDGMFKLRGTRPVDDSVIIIGIDDTSLEILGRWPWPRSHHATFLQIINNYKPKYVVFDILFPESDPENDALLAQVAKEGNNLYLASHFEISSSDNFDFSRTPKANASISRLPNVSFEGHNKDMFLKASNIIVPTEPLFSAAKRVSAINAPLDSDGRTRHLPLVIEYLGKLYPTMSLELACDYLGIDSKDIFVKPGKIAIFKDNKEMSIPIDSNGSILLNYGGPLENFKLYSYVQLLHEYNKSKDTGSSSMLESLRGKVLFVGHMATGTVDARAMPFSNAYPAVGGHATSFANILDKDIMRPAPVFINILIILLASLSLSYCTKRGRKMVVNLAVMFAVFVAYALFSFILFAYMRFWVVTFTPLVTILATYIAIAINHYEAVRYEKKILENELQIAHQIQQSFLPKDFPKTSFLTFAAKCIPAKHVGGDLYDFAELEGDKIGIMIGDVSGKGVGAALYMARGISSFRTHSRVNIDAAKTLSAINETFAKEGMEKSFITMQYILVDTKTKKFSFSNGGHNTVLHYLHKEKKIEELDTSSGMPIGIMEGMDYENKEIHFTKDDILFLYSDGISEAMDKKHREFGIDRVKEIISSNAERSAEDIMSVVYDEIAQFSKGAPQHDDMTIIIIKGIEA